MPAEVGYQQQTGPVSAPSLPRATPDAFGAGIGAAITQFGDTLHRSDLNTYKIERQQHADSEAADFGTRFAQAREAMDKASIDARANAQPGAAGHADAMAATWDQARVALLDGITQESVRRSAQQQLDEFGGRFRSSEYQYEVGARVGKQTNDIGTMSLQSANRAARSHDPQAFAEELSLGAKTITAMAGVPADVKDKLVKEHDALVTDAFVNGLNNTNPRGALALIDAGAFDTMLAPHQIDRLRTGSEVEIRRQDAVVAHQAALAKAAVADQVQTYRGQHDAGIEVPDQQLAQAQSALATNGDQSGALSIGLMRTEQNITRETKPWTPRQFDGEINRLAALRKPSNDEQARLSYLQKIRPSRASQFNDDPGGWAASNGMAPPPLNFADPASLDARARWARTMAPTVGQPVPLLSKNEAYQLEAQAGTGNAGRLEVANQIAAFGGRTAVDVARQVMPNDPTMARLVVLRPNDRAATLAGAEARKGNRAIIDGTAGNDARELFNQRMGNAGQLMSQSDVGATFEIARNLYADFAVKHGIQDFQPKIWDSFVHRALGGAQYKGEWRGGVGSWNGAATLLPQRLSQRQFDDALSRMQFKPGSANTPVWGNGVEMKPVDVRGFTPVQRPDGRYEFRNAQGEHAVRRDGSMWTLDIDALAGALANRR